MTEMCRCWGDVIIHEGHCCFRDLPDDATVVPCGHQDEGMAMHNAAQEARKG